MSEVRFDDDQRQSFRCPVAEPRQECAIQFGADLVQGKLLDESAGGFSVLAACVAEPGAGQMAKLQTDSGWFAVRVVHVAEVPPPERSDAAASQEEPRPWFRLGLVRLREIPPPQPPVSVLAGSFRIRLQQWCPSGGQLTSVLLLLTVLVVPLVLTAVIRHMGQHVPTRKDSDSATDLRAAGFAVDPPDLLGGSKTSKTLDRAAHDVEKTLEEAIRRLAGTTAIVAPEVAQQLQLTEAQIARIGRIGAATEEALRKLGPASGLNGDQQLAVAKRRAELLEKARGEALEVLNEEQRAQWQKLIGTPAAGQPATKTGP
jgi:hypothetical protein